MSLMQMTLSGGAFVLFIVTVRALALHRLPKAAFLALWEMAALRLLVPFAIPLPFRVFPPARHLPVVGEFLAADRGSAPGPAALSGVALPAVWLAAAALMAAYFTVCYVRAGRRFRTAVRDDTPAVRRWLAGRTLCRPLEVRRSALAPSPLTYGVLRPVILLPEDMNRDDEAALTCILTHEFIHVRRFDAVAKLAFAAVLCVHWFNPLVWVLYVLANRDLELSCDERVMDILGGREKACYALTLINMEESRNWGFSPCSHFSKLAIEERIEAIMKYKKASVLAAALAVVLVIGATTAFAASGNLQDTQTDPVGQNDKVDIPQNQDGSMDIALHSASVPQADNAPGDGSEADSEPAELDTSNVRRTEVGDSVWLSAEGEDAVDYILVPGTRPEK